MVSSALLSVASKLLGVLREQKGRGLDAPVRRTMAKTWRSNHVPDPRSPDSVSFRCPYIERTTTAWGRKAAEHWKCSKYTAIKPQSDDSRHDTEIILLVRESKSGRRKPARRS